MTVKGSGVTAPGPCHVLIHDFETIFSPVLHWTPERRESAVRDLTLGLALMVALAAPVPAAGTSGAAGAEETLDATDPERILALAHGYGEAALTTDNLGDPLIEGRIGEKDYDLFFYGCDEGRDCTSLTFSATWEAGDLTDEKMADWNREKRFGKAYLDQDGNATVEMSVNLHGGVTHANFDNTIDWWRLVLAEFAGYFDFE
jgi:hypothetical protein